MSTYGEWPPRGIGDWKITLSIILSLSLSECDGEDNFNIDYLISSQTNWPLSGGTGDDSFDV